MPVLTSIQKKFVTRQLARCYSPSEVSAQLKEEFGITVPRNQIARYNPNTRSGAGLSKPLQDYFDVENLEFLSNNSDIPIVHKNFRIRELYDLYLLIKVKQPLAAARLLEQAAREAGGAFARSHDSDTPTARSPSHDDIMNDMDLVYDSEPEDEEPKEQI